MAKHNIRLALGMLIIIAGTIGAAYCCLIYPQVFATAVSSEKTVGILPDEPIVINFSQAVFTDKIYENLSIAPAEPLKLNWENENRRLVISAPMLWKIGAEYKITIPAGRGVMLTKFSGTEIAFSTIKYPEISGVFPQDGSSNVVLDIEDPIVFGFKESTENFYLDFGINPNGGMAYINNPEKTEFKLLPKEKLKSGQVYSLKVRAKYIKDQGDKNYKEIYAGEFMTMPAPSQIPEKDHELRLLQARKFTQAKITTGKYIDINLSSQVLSVFENGTLIDSFMISTGKRGMETPKGSYQIRNKAPRVWSKAYGLYMPLWMAVASDGKFGIHELPEWPGGYKEGANHLGIPVSHGCIRLGVGPAKFVFDWTAIGTPVVIY
ncbi:MAG: L,D-transpeptidase [Parcubacteria group bacterium]